MCLKIQLRGVLQETNSRRWILTLVWMVADATSGTGIRGRKSIGIRTFRSPKERKELPTRSGTFSRGCLTTNPCGYSPTSAHDYTVRWFCGHGPECRDPSKPELALQIAKRNVRERYAHVGILTDLENTAQLFRLLLPDFFEGDPSRHLCGTQTSPSRPVAASAR